jgi:hypothetical protein
LSVGSLWGVCRNKLGQLSVLIMLIQQPLVYIVQMLPTSFLPLN